MTSIGFIGGGKMAEAIIKGLITAREFTPTNIRVFDVQADRLEQLRSTYHVVTGFKGNQQVIKDSDVIVFSVKPQDMAEVVRQLEVPQGKLVISIAAGITLKFLEKKFSQAAVIRAMPNNPALIGQGVTALAAGKQAKTKDLELAKKVFRAVGQVVEVDEKLIDIVTGLSGSGPAYVYLFIEALTEAGEKYGLDQAVAQQLALQTVLGSAATMVKTAKSAKELKQMVASPGGTTIEALKVLEKKKFNQIIAEAVKAAADKSKKLSQ